MTTNISCLETFALNILKNSSPNKIVSNVNVTELEPCTLCNQELFLYKIKRPITLLTCGHIFHRDCIESSIKICSKCPKQNCEKEIESVVDSMPGSQDLDLIVTSSSIFKSPIITQKSDTSKKRTRNYLLFPNKLSNKKTKHVKKESLTLKKLIKELSTEPSTSQNPVIRKENANNFVDLYNNITLVETQNEIINQEVITTYYLF
ncbi:43315_t:CDS:1, partial [Gigaspora margarita]